MADASERASRKRGMEPGQDSHSKRIFRNNHQGQSAWERHQLYVERYLKAYRGDQTKSKLNDVRQDHKNDWDILKDRHRFLREDDDGEGGRSGHDALSTSYEDQVAKKYYDNLFKDLVLADLKHFKSGNIGLRWRSEEDVIEGVGQFTCANIRCDHHQRLQRSVELTSYEVNFTYAESKGDSGSSEKVNKSALVKVVLCSRCGQKLRYKREQEKRKRKGVREQERE